MSVSYIVTDNTVTLNYSDGEIEVLPISRAGSVLEAIKAGLPEEEIRTRASASRLICNYMNGAVKVEQNRVLYHGEELHGFLVDKILEFANKGYPYKSLLAFLERLMANPSNRAINELYKFLERGSLAITDEGKFRAYKSIQPDWTDWHSGKCDNHIGNVLEMPRRCVDDNCNNGCSHGFHVGTLDYVNEFHPGSGIIIIVEVDPADVVSVPVENCGKVRVCKYKVVGRYTGPLPSYLHTAPDPQPSGGDWVTQTECGAAGPRKYAKGTPKADNFEQCPLDRGENLNEPDDCQYFYNENQCPYTHCRLEDNPDDDLDDDDDDDGDDSVDDLTDGDATTQDVGPVEAPPQDQHITITKPSGNQVFITINQ